MQRWCAAPRRLRWVASATLLVRIILRTSARPGPSFHPDQTGAIDLRVFWSADTNTGDIEWLISTVYLGDDDPITPTFNAEQTAVDAAGSLNNNLMIAGLGAVTQTGCAPGEILVIDVALDADGVNDTLRISAAPPGLEVTINR